VIGAASTLGGPLKALFGRISTRLNAEIVTPRIPPVALAIDSAISLTFFWASSGA